MLNQHAVRHSIKVIKQQYNKPLVGVEIGTSYGCHAITLLKTLNIKHLYLVDPYKSYNNLTGVETMSFDELYNYTKKRLSKFNKHTFVRKTSSDAVNDIPNKLDFVYIDGNHYYDFVKKDLEAYYPKVRVGGMICGHDFNIPDVAKAVTEFATIKKVKVNQKGLPGDWWFKK